MALAQSLINSRSAKLSERAANAAPSPTLTITAQVTALKAAGKDVIGFTAGEPDFDTPVNVKDAAKLALDKGQTKYTASSGTVELKNAIIAKHQRDNNLTYKPNQVIVSAGAKHSIYNLMQAIIGPGDKVIIPAPYWVSYPEQVMLAGGTPIVVQTDHRFIATAAAIERHITPRTKIIVLNSPSNPTGAVYSRQELHDIADLAVRHGIYVMSDEIYEKITYGSEIVSIASFNDDIYKLTLTVNGLSKSHAMTGWRIGWLAGDAEIVAAMGRIQDQSTSNPTSITQAASVEALNGPQDATEMMRKAFQERRDLIVGLLNAIPGIECLIPGGAFYVFPKISGLFGKQWQHPDTGETKVINNSVGFYEYLITTALVAIVPGDGFGADDYVRLSYATSPKLIQDGLTRIAEAVKRLD